MLRTLTFAVALAGLLAGAAPISAANAAYTFYGKTSSGKTFNRPNLDLATLSGKLTQYTVQPFFSDANATCTVSGIQEGGFDGVVYLYKGAFDPAQPLSNLVAASDSGDQGAGSAKIAAIALDAQVSYYLVTTANEAAATGSFSNFVACAGAARILAGDGTMPAYDGRYGELVRGRFRVSGTWKNYQAQTGSATFVPLGSDETGVLWFFSPSNFEVMLKILDACGLNNRYWVFYAALTDVEFHITVTDTFTGVEKKYDNTLGVSAPAVTDTSAFATCP